MPTPFSSAKYKTSLQHGIENAHTAPTCQRTTTKTTRRSQNVLKISTRKVDPPSQRLNRLPIRKAKYTLRERGHEKATFSDNNVLLYLKTQALQINTKDRNPTVMQGKSQQFYL
jgi:hypothetical protein